MSTCSNADREHVVYELWAGDICEYVGQTCRLQARLAEHDAWSRGLVTEVRTTPCPTQADALRLEQETIDRLQPRRNQHGMQRPSAFQQLVESTYPGDLPADVAAWRADGLGWRPISKKLSAKTGVKVSHETARTWYSSQATA